MLSKGYGLTTSTAIYAIEQLLQFAGHVVGYAIAFIADALGNNRFAFRSLSLVVGGCSWFWLWFVDGIECEWKWRRKVCVGIALRPLGQPVGLSGRWKGLAESDRLEGKSAKLMGVI